MAKDFFQSAFNALSGADFEETPVEVEEFVQSDKYLGLPPLSDYQYTMVKAMSQIYRRETLIALWGEQRGNERWKQTCKEIVLQLGKGSGKDYTSTIAVSYVVYLLLCLNDPARYYGLPSGDAIDIINIAINSDQANRVFFKNFVKRIQNSPWFDGKYTEKNGEINFIKNVNVYSGHSEREAFEGYNTIMVILDEISGFAMATGDDDDNEEAEKKTSRAIYKMYRGSITSRYPDFGKLVLLSFPRFKNDYIQQAYDKLVAEKEVVEREHRFKIDPDLPDGYEGNEFVIKWDEDHVIRYTRPNVFVLKRPSWEVNPTKRIENYKDDFYDDPGDALGRFACMPSNLARGFFKNKQAITDSFVKTNGVDPDGIFRDDFRPRPETLYYMHVDLAQKHDHCAVAMAHVDRWVEVGIGAQNYKEILPYVVVDAIRWWTPTKSKSVDFKDVVDYILEVRRRGFDLRLVTFDRWNSHDTMNNLERQGIKTDTLSVDKKHYDDFLSVMYSDRLLGPNVELLKDELGELRQVVKNTKVTIDHPRKGSKDLSDAVCGSIFNAVANTQRPLNTVVDILTPDDIRRRNREDAERRYESAKDTGIIHAPPKAKIPTELEEFLSGARIL